jgi:hypothetical protein
MSCTDHRSRLTSGSWRQLVASAFAGLLAGCAGTGVPAGPAPETVADPENAVPYRLVLAGQGDALAREQMTKAVQAALAARGWRPAVTPAEAAQVVTLDLQLGPPHDGLVRSSEAEYEVTPGKVEYQSVAIGINATGGTIYDMVPVKQPDTRIYTGEHPVTVTRTVFEKRLRLTARDSGAAPGGPERVAWSVEFVVEGPSRDWRRMLPALAGPGRPFLAPEVAASTVLHLDEDSGRIESVEQEL